MASGTLGDFRIASGPDEPCARRHGGGTAGFTLLEVLLSLVLLGGGGLMLARMMADDTRRTGSRDASATAQQIARNEIERLRITRPFFPDVAYGHLWTDDTARFQVDEYGNYMGAPIPGTARYIVEIDRSTICEGGQIIVDNQDSPPYTGGCEGVNNLRPQAHYTLRVIHPSRLRDSGIDTLVHELVVGPVGRFANYWTPATAP